MRTPSVGTLGTGGGRCLCSSPARGPAPCSSPARGGTKLGNTLPFPLLAQHQRGDRILRPRFLLLARARNGRNSLGTAARAIKPLLSNYHISLHQRPGDAKPKLEANARLGGGLLALEPCPTAPSTPRGLAPRWGKALPLIVSPRPARLEEPERGSRARACLRWASSRGTAKKIIGETPYASP